MIHIIGRLLYLKELPSSNTMITPAEKNALRKELLVCRMQVLHSRCNFASLLLSSFQTLFQLLQQQCDSLNKMNGCLASKPKVTLDVLVCGFVSQTNTKPSGSCQCLIIFKKKTSCWVVRNNWMIDFCDE